MPIAYNIEHAGNRLFTILFELKTGSFKGFVEIYVSQRQKIMSILS
jgi:hypothetical protein